MSDEQRHQVQVAPAEAQAAETTGDGWGDPISEERQAELEALQRAWDANHGDRPSPFALGPNELVLEEVRAGSSQSRRILTGADVFWLAARAFAGPNGNLVSAKEALLDIPVAWSQGIPTRLALPGLTGLNLAGAYLRGIHLERATLDEAHLEKAHLEGVHLEGAVLRATHLEGSDLEGAHLEGARLYDTHLERAKLERAHLERALLLNAYLERADLRRAHLAGASLLGTHLEGARLETATLTGASLAKAHLEGADLRNARLEGANLTGAHLEAKLEGKRVLPAADMRGAFLDTGSLLNDISLTDGAHGSMRVADVRWGGANLAVVDWTPLIEPVTELGDERAAREWKPKPFEPPNGKPSRQQLAAARAMYEEEQARDRLEVFRAAVRANRQLATALRDQGMNEEADRFAYRAQVLQRQVFRQQGKRGRAVLSWFLDRVAGHGYQPQRSLYTYVGVILAFALLYLLAGNGLLAFGLPASQYAAQGLPWYEALILSVSSFHGRGFFQPLQSPGDPVAIIAAAEAIFGLFIEVSFIATFTQRFFGK